MTQPRTRDLVSISEIGRMLGYGPSTVANWRTRHADFPAASDRSARGDQFDLAAVLRWLKANGKINDQHQVALVLAHASAVTGSPADAFNACLLYLAARRLMRTRGPSRDQRADVNTTVDVGVAFDEIRDEYPNIELSPWIDSNPLMPAFDELEQLTEERGAARLVDELYEEYSRNLGRDRLHLPGPALCALVARLAGPTTATSGDRRRVLDPMTAAGNLLLAVLAATAPGDIETYAADLSPYSSELAELRLRLHGYEVHVEPGNVLTEDPFPGVQANTAVAMAPRWPQGSGKALSPSLAAVLGRGEQQRADLAMPFYISDHLTPTGRGIVVVPLIALTRSGDAEVRAHMLRRGIVEGVISLPPGVFDNAALQLALLIVRAPDGPDRHRDIIMIDGSDPSFAWATDSVATAEQVAEIYLNVAGDDRGQEVPDQVTLVPVLDALAPGVSLGPAMWTTRMMDSRPQEAADTLSDAIGELQQARKVACSGRPAALQHLAIGDAPTWVAIDQLVNNGILRIHRAPTVRHSEFADAGVPVLTVTSVTQLNGRAGGYLNPGDPRIGRTRLTEPGDVIFATIGAKAVVDQEGGHILAGHVVAIEVLDTNVITPEVLATYLSTEVVAGLATGATIQRVNPRHASVPLFPPRQAQNLTAALTRLRRQRTDIVTWIEAIDASLQSLVDAAASGVQIGDLPGITTSDNPAAAGPTEERDAE